MVVIMLCKRSLKIKGRNVILEEVEPRHFSEIIKWRNNPEFNKFLNQPYVLTKELQYKWYEKFMEDKTQGLFIVIDKEGKKPFATIGYTDYNVEKKYCVVGRLLVGEPEYNGSDKWKEAILLFNDYIYNHLKVDTVFAHVADGNIASIKWHKKWGYIENFGDILFPLDLEVNGFRQKEYYRSKSMYDDWLKQE